MPDSPSRAPSNVPLHDADPADAGRSMLIVRVVAIHDDATVDVEVEPGGTKNSVLFKNFPARSRE